MDNKDVFTNIEVDNKGNSDKNGIYINNIYYSYDEYEDIEENYEHKNDYEEWDDYYMDEYSDYYEDGYYFQKNKNMAIKNKKVVKDTTLNSKEENDDLNNVSDINDIVKELPKEIKECKQGTGVPVKTNNNVSKADKRYYAVKKGRNPGVYESFEEALMQVKNLTDSDWRTFRNRIEAEKYLGKVYYAVKKGRRRGVYESFEEANMQIEGFEDSEMRKFKSITEAKKYIGKINTDSKKCYAVIRGKNPGIYKDFDLAQKQVNGFSNGFIKKFSDIEKAREYLSENYGKFKFSIIDDVEIGNRLKIYTDGSYYEKTNKYGSAFVVIENGEEIYRFLYSDKDIIGKRNISGEIIAAIRALEWVYITKYSYNVELNYDFSPIKDICTKKRNLKTSYEKILRSIYKMCENEGICIKFNDIESHSGNYWNDFVDKLAKSAAKEEDICEMKYFEIIEKESSKKKNLNAASDMIMKRKKIRDNKKIVKANKPICVQASSSIKDKIRNMFKIKNKY